MISACAELARRLVRGQPTQEMKATMLSWVSTSETKGKDKEGSKPLVVVGFAYAVSRFCISPKLTYITSTYSIGKERIVKGEVRNLVCDVISNLIYGGVQQSHML